MKQQNKIDKLIKAYLDKETIFVNSKEGYITRFDIIRGTTTFNVFLIEDTEKELTDLDAEEIELKSNPMEIINYGIENNILETISFAKEIKKWKRLFFIAFTIALCLTFTLIKVLWI